MTKYDGIRVVESELNVSADVKVVKKGSGLWLKAFLIRFFAAALIPLALFSLKNFNDPTAKKIVETVKTAVCYDLDKREDKQYYGYSEIYEKLKKETVKETADKT